MDVHQPPFVPRDFLPPREDIGLPSSSRPMSSRCREISVSSPRPSLLEERTLQVHYRSSPYDVTSTREGRIPSPPLIPRVPLLRYCPSSPYPGRSMDDVVNENNKRSLGSTLPHCVSFEEKSMDERDETSVPKRGDVTPDPVPKPHLTIDVDGTEDGARRIKRRKIASRRDNLGYDRWQSAYVDLSMPTSVPLSPKKKLFTPGCMKNMQELQALVRGYCNTPLGQRSSSLEAKTIQETTGYPLVQPRRRATLQSLAPIIYHMDRQTKRSTAYWESETNCRVEKAPAIYGGKYRYYSLDSSKARVSSQEYKHRYMSSISRNSSRRMEHTRRWIAQLNDSEG